MKTTTKFTAHEKLQKVLEKARQLEQRFADSKSMAIEQLETLKDNIKDAEAEAHDIYKMYVLNEIELSAYQDAKSNLDNLKNQLKATESKIDSIDDVKKEELASLYQNEVKPLESELHKERVMNQHETRKTMLEAKKVYLDAIKEQGKQFRVTRNPEILVENLKVSAGLKANAYTSLTDNLQPLLRNDYDNSPGIDVRPDELRNAYVQGI